MMRCEADNETIQKGGRATSIAHLSSSLEGAMHKDGKKGRAGTIIKIVVINAIGGVHFASVHGMRTRVLANGGVKPEARSQM